MARRTVFENPRIVESQIIHRASFLSGVFPRMHLPLALQDERRCIVALGPQGLRNSSVCAKGKTRAKALEDDTSRKKRETRFLEFLRRTQTRRGISGNSETTFGGRISVQPASSSILHYTHPLSVAHDPPGAFDRRRDVSKRSCSLTRILMNINFARER